jgi:predicted nucleotidyltransferase
MTSPKTLAVALGVSDRTVRRAIDEGVIRGRHGHGRLELSPAEELYARQNWPLLSGLRGALRTEPGVACAVLFGSASRSDWSEGSDVDVLVRFRDPDPWSRLDLEDRLERAVRRQVQVVTMTEAERAPILLDEILRDGRPLVDRNGTWGRLTALRAKVADAAAGEERDLVRSARSAVDRLLAAN